MPFGQPPFAGLLVERWEVVPGLLHHLHHTVERHAVDTVGEGGVDVRALTRWRQRRHCARCKGFAPARIPDRRSSEVVFQPHLGRVSIWAGYRQIVGWRRLLPSRRGTYLALATHLGARYRGVLLHEVPHSTSAVANALSTRFLLNSRVLSRWYSTAGTTPQEPQVGAVTIIPPAAFSSATASA